jgi:glycosyltransferase involved in cell wall biosynthesis
MAKPVIVGLYNDNDGGFENKINCLQVSRGDEKALANAIIWALENHKRLEQIGQSGYELYRSRYSFTQISEKLKGVLPL